MASVEILVDESRRLRRQLAEQFATRIASELLSYPPLRRQDDYYVPDVEAGSDIQRNTAPTADQVRAVRTHIAAWAIDLIGAAIAQKGVGGGKASVDLLCRFFAASGMIQRLRCEEIERRHRESRAKGRPDYSHILVVWPKWIRFWATPRISYQSRLDGTNSLEGVDRDGLIEVAVDFYRTGIRCPLFEKCIIEALVHAELFATKKSARQGDLSTSVTDQFLRAYAFRKTLGDEPTYGIYILIGYLLKRVLYLGIFSSLMAWALVSYSDGVTWKNISALTALGLVGASVAGRWLVCRIVQWAQPDAKMTAAALLRKHPVLRAINELEGLAKIVGTPSMSTSLAREAALRCFSNGGYFDQVVLPYLDRAIAAGEFLWTPHWGPLQFEEYIEDTETPAALSGSVSS